MAPYKQQKQFIARYANLSESPLRDSLFTIRSGGDSLTLVLLSGPDCLSPIFSGSARTGAKPRSCRRNIFM